MAFVLAQETRDKDLTMKISGRHVCLVGRSRLTIDLARECNADEFWGVGVVYRDFPLSRTARIYEIHPAWMVSQEAYDPHHWQWLTHQRQTQVVTTDPDVPNGALYPLDEILEMVSHIRRGEEPNKFLTSSLDFMLAHAVWEGDIDEITLAGFDMTTDTEYGYQVPGAAFWLGVCAGVGIQVNLPSVTPLLKANLYALEGGQMIGRQKLEHYKHSFKLQMEGAQAVYNVLLGQVQMAHELFQHEPTDTHREAFARAQQKAMTAEADLHAKSGAFQAVVMLVKDCDLQEPDDMIVPMFGQIKFKQES